MIVKCFSGLVIVILLLVIVATVLALPTMLVWNWVMPEIFGLKTIGLFEALGLNLLCSFLFRSCGSSISK